MLDNFDCVAMQQQEGSFLKAVNPFSSLLHEIYYSFIVPRFNISQGDQDLKDPFYSFYCDVINNHIYLQNISLNSTPKKVLIIGSGLSGACAAYELAKLNLLYQKQFFDIQLIDANSKVGGRLLSINVQDSAAADSLTNSIFIEAGAMRIPLKHKIVVAYCKQFNLQLVPFFQAVKFLYWKNTVCKVNEQAAETPFKIEYSVLCKMLKEDDPNIKFITEYFNDEELKKDPLDLLEHFKQIVINKIANLFEKKQNENQQQQPIQVMSMVWNQFIKEFEAYSLNRFLDEHGVSDAAMSLVEKVFGLNFNNFNLLSSLYTLLFQNYYEPENMVCIKGGMIELVNAMLNDPMVELNKRVLLNAKVTKIKEYEKDSSKLHVTWQDVRLNDYMEHTILCDYCVNTVPVMCAQRQIVRGISRTKFTSFQNIPSITCTKVFAVFDSRFWEEFGIGVQCDDNCSGAAASSSVTTTAGVIRTLNMKLGMSLYFMNNEMFHVKSNKGVVLLAYAFGNQSQYWKNLSENEAKQVILSELSELFPSVKEFPHFDLMRYSWASASFTGGAALSNMDAENQLLYYRHMLTAELNYKLFYAGEAVSSFGLGQTWIQGAMESGIRSAILIARDFAGYKQISFINDVNGLQYDTF